MFPVISNFIKNYRNFKIISMEDLFRSYLCILIVKSLEELSDSLKLMKTYEKKDNSMIINTILNKKYFFIASDKFKNSDVFNFGLVLMIHGKSLLIPIGFLDLYLKKKKYPEEELFLCILKEKFSEFCKAIDSYLYIFILTVIFVHYLYPETQYFTLKDFKTTIEIQEVQIYNQEIEDLFKKYKFYKKFNFVNSNFINLQIIYHLLSEIETPKS